MIDLSKVKKLISKLENLAKRLDHEKSIIIHHQVNQFYYLEKAAELKILLNLLEEHETKMNNITCQLEYTYELIYSQWRKDVRWISNQHDKTIKM